MLIQWRLPVAGALVLALLVSAMLLYPGCADKGYTIEKGVLSLASDFDCPPFTSIEAGEVSGFDVELGKLIAEELGLEYRLVETPWNELFSGLDQGNYDAVMGSVTITHDRMKQYDFSRPYLETDQAIMVLEESGIQSGNELPGKSVAVLDESTPQYAAWTIPGVEDIRSYDSVAEVFSALDDGKVDFMIMDITIARHHQENTGRIRMIAEILTLENYGVVVRSGNQALLDRINQALEKLMESGAYERLGRQYFGIHWDNHRSSELP